MGYEYWVLAFLWIIYCVLHSALISKNVVHFFERRLGDYFRFYRLLFNVFSLAALVPLVMYSHSAQLRGHPVFSWSGSWRMLQYLLLALAAALVISGARHYSIARFLGFRQIRVKSSGTAMTETGDIDTTGVLGLTRHPWYVAVFILLWASNLNLSSVVTNVVLSAYLVIGTQLEERKLVLEFGNKYREYKRRVSMFLPFKWLISRAARRIRQY